MIYYPSAIGKLSQLCRECAQTAIKLEKSLFSIGNIQCCRSLKQMQKLPKHTHGGIEKLHYLGKKSRPAHTGITAILLNKDGSEEMQ